VNAIATRRIDGGTPLLGGPVDLAEQLAWALMLPASDSPADADAVAAALRERLERDRAFRKAELPRRLATLARRLREAYDTRPVTGAEWEATRYPGATRAQ
jgi:hypothetical protein